MKIKPKRSFRKEFKYRFRILIAAVLTLLTVYYAASTINNYFSGNTGNYSLNNKNNTENHTTPPEEKPADTEIPYEESDKKENEIPDNNSDKDTETERPHNETDKTEEPLSDTETETPEEPASEEKTDTKLPDGFVYLKEFLPEARFDIRYATTHNFTGQIVDGYLSDNVCLTIEAAEALKKASEYLKEQGYGILIYDAYRPKRAVEFFIEWGKQPEDYSTKDEFYPSFTKEYLFNNGYLARRSAHSRGSTVDLTLFYLDTGELVDMGSPYDFLDTISNHGTDKITEQQTRNRNILKEAMKKAGFKELRTEWWHYTLVNEPYPDTYFDFVIE